MGMKIAAVLCFEMQNMPETARNVDRVLLAAPRGFCAGVEMAIRRNGEVTGQPENLPAGQIFNSEIGRVTHGHIIGLLWGLSQACRLIG